MSLTGASSPAGGPVSSARTPVAAAADPRGCVPLLVAGAIFITTAVALVFSAWSSSTIRVRNVGFAYEMHRQDVVLESGEELTYAAQGAIRAGETLAVKENASKRIEADRVLAEHQRTLSLIEKIRPKPATDEKLTLATAEIRRAEDAVELHDSSRKSIRERGTARIETLEQELDRIERVLVTATGKRSSAELELNHKNSELSRIKDQVQKQVLPESRRIEAEAAVNLAQQNLTLVQAEEKALAQSKSYYRDKIERARADVTENVEQEDKALAQSKEKLRTAKDDKARLEKQAAEEIAAERERLDGLVAIEKKNIDSLERQARQTIVARLSGRTLHAPVRLAGRPAVIAYDALVISAELAGVGPEQLRSGDVRLVLICGEREEPCLITSFPASEEKGWTRVLLEAARMDWGTLADPDRARLSVRAEYGFVARVGMDPGLWTAGFASGLIGLIILTLSAAVYRQLPGRPRTSSSSGSSSLRTITDRVKRATSARVSAASSARVKKVSPSDAGAVSSRPPLPLPADPTVSIADVQPGIGPVDRAPLEVTITGKNLHTVTEVQLGDVTCPIVKREEGSLLVSLTTYLVDPGGWHFVVKTASGTQRSPVPFKVPAAPAPAVTRVRPAEASRDPATQPVVEVEGRHFARLESVRLEGEGGSFRCTVVRSPPPEPNDKKLGIKLDPTASHGVYKVVVETASGPSAGDVTFRILPTSIDRVDTLARRLLAKVILGPREGDAKESVEGALRASRDLDPKLREAAEGASRAAALPDEDLQEAADELGRFGADPAVAERLKSLRQASPEWIGDLVERLYARQIDALEPRSRRPSDEEIQGFVRAAQNASRLLRVGSALFWNEARIKNLRASLTAAVVVYRDRELPHVFSKITQTVPDAVESSGSPDEGWV